MKRPIRVLFVLRPADGGMLHHVATLLKGLDPERVDIRIACPPDVPGMPVLPFGALKPTRLDIRGELSPRRDWLAARAVRELAAREQVDLVHAHGFKAGFICSLHCRRGAPGHKLVYTIHNQIRRQKNPLVDAASLVLARMTTRRADHIITVSAALQNEAASLLRAPAAKLTCIYNGIDVAALAVADDAATTRASFGFSAEDVLVGSAARLIPQKGIQYLIRAAAILKMQMPRILYLIIGDGPNRDRLQAQAEAAGLRDTMIFTGYREDAVRIMSALDVFTLPTLEEGFSLTTMEAMALGKSVVVSAVGGLPELVTGETGVLVPPGDEHALAEALALLLNNPARRQELGGKARERVATCFSVRNLLQEHYRLYEELCAE